MLLAERKSLQAASKSAGMGVGEGNEVVWRWLINVRMKEGVRH